MPYQVTLNGVPTEDAALGYTNTSTGAEAGQPIAGQQWQSSADGTTWTDIAGANAATFTPGDALVGQQVRVVVTFETDGTTTASTATSGAEEVANVNDEPVATDTAIAGDAKVGGNLTLTGDFTDADGYDADAVAYQWETSDGGTTWSPIAKATAPTYTLTEAEAGLLVRAVASYTDNGGEAETVVFGPTAEVAAAGTGTGGGTGGGTAPGGNAGGTLTVKGVAKQLETLSTEDLVGDPDGATGPRSYKWQAQNADGTWTDIASATDIAYTLGQTDVGKAIRAAVSFTDGKGNPETVYSNATAKVEDGQFAPFGSLTVQGQVRVGGTINMADDVSDHDLIPGDRSYQWQVQNADGTWVNLEGASGNEPYLLTAAQQGRSIRATVTFTDGDGKAETFVGKETAPVTSADNTLPTGAVTLDDGPGTAPVEGTAITADASAVADADGPAAPTFAYAWSRQGAGGGAWTAIQGADGASYTPDDADVGAKLRVKVSYTDAKGNKEVVSAETAAAVGNVNDAPTGTIALDGQAVRGKVVTASTAGLADADGIGTISLQWERLGGETCTPGEGATGASYTFAEADVGTKLRAVASWTDKGGANEKVFAETGVVAAEATTKPITLSPPESGETREDAAADDWTSVDLAKAIAEGGTFTPPADLERIELADGVLSYGPGTTEAYIARLFLCLLGREGDVSGLTFTADLAEAGFSRAGVADLFLSSGEYEARHGTQTDLAFVQGLYADCLGSEGGAAEHAFWVDKIAGGLSRAEVAASIVGSAESADYKKADTTGVFVPDYEGASARGLYKCALGREGEAGGVKYWSNVLEEGVGVKALGDGFDDTPEFIGRHGALSNQAYVEKMYQDGLGRAADAGGLDYWTGLLDSGQLGRGHLAVIYATSEEVRVGLDWSL